MILQDISKELNRRLHPDARYYHIENTEHFFLRNLSPIYCNDGFCFSVQASFGHYCTPKNDIGPWTTVEIGYPSIEDNLLSPYFSGGVYPRVPIEIAALIIQKHGGYTPCLY